MLEDSMVDKRITFDEVDILLCGDLNARISDYSPVHFDDEMLHENHLKDFSNTTKRCSQDKVLNFYGKNLLNMSTALELSISNGLCNGDQKDCYSFISDPGSSVNDYFLTSTSFFQHMYEYMTLEVKERIESDHFPLVLCVDKLSDVSFWSQPQDLNVN